MNRIITTLILASFVTIAKAQFFDTTGIANWPLLTNSYDTWMRGAFDSNRDPNNQSDYGWGFYDIQTHFIMGDSIYIIKTQAGNYKAISVDQLASGVYTVSYSDLDGSNYVTKTLDRSPYGSKNFFYYSIDQDVVKDFEPATAGWDIVFTKYLTFIPFFGGYYPVSGALTNRGVEVSQVEFNPGGSYSVNDTVNFPMSDNISTIGYDWKDAGPVGIVIYDTLVYYVKDQNGNVNELKFTDYSGSATGKMVFEVNGQPDSIVLDSGNVSQVYYSLQAGTEIIKNQDNAWDVALLAQASFSAIPVRINDANGVELYVYPNADITQWNSIGIEENTVDVVSIYPNPASDFINIALRADMRNNVTASLINQSGQIVKTEEISFDLGLSEASMSLDNVVPGVYLLQLSNSEINAISRIIVTP